MNTPLTGPPADRRDPDADDAAEGRPRFLGAAVTIAVLAVAAALGLAVWVFAGRDDPEQTAAPVTGASSRPPETRLSPTEASPTTTAPTGVSAAARCGSEYLWRQFGTAVRARECDPSFAVIEAPGGSVPLALYRWQDERWTYVSDPFSGVCRDQLATGGGVPERFLRDFPPCGLAMSTSPLTATTSPDDGGSGAGDPTGGASGTTPTRTRATGTSESEGASSTSAMPTPSLTGVEETPGA